MYKVQIKKNPESPLLKTQTSPYSLRSQIADYVDPYVREMYAMLAGYNNVIVIL